MNNSKRIKQILKPTIVVQYYLGKPVRSNGLGMWYKSPFRNERTASFLVNDIKGIHDFGTSIHYDVISFVQELFRIDFKTAIKKLSYDFNLIDSEPISKGLMAYRIRQQEEKIQMKKKLDSWFYSTYGKLCDKLNMEKKIATHVNREARKITYFYISELEYWTELFIDATEEDKEKLFKIRGDIRECLEKF